MIQIMDNRSLLYRFKSSDRYHSFTYPQGGYEIIGDRLHLSKIGHIKIKLHREIKGKDLLKKNFPHHR